MKHRLGRSIAAVFEPGTELSDEATTIGYPSAGVVVMITVDIGLYLNNPGMSQPDLMLMIWSSIVLCGGMALFLIW